MSGLVFNLIVIRAADVEASRAFYALLGLDLRPERHGAGPLHYAAEIDGVIFEVYPKAAGSPGTAALRLGFTIGALGDTIERLRRAGAVISAAPAETPFGLRAVVIDPDGHKIELRQSPASAPPPDL